MSQTLFSTVSADGIEVFYRHSGSTEKPTILLLHGFPTSSHQYRNLIPLLATKYHVIAPDLPGFGFTNVPASREYKYTFEALAATLAAFLDAVHVTRFTAYIFDYGAPTLLRLALQRPDAIAAIVSQNGNAYEVGLGEAWAPIQRYWASESAADREVVRRSLLSLEAFRWQYEHGEPDATVIAPETYTLDYALLQRPGNAEIQLDLFLDYRRNVELYPRFHEYFRASQVPLLAIWGQGDAFFVPPGAKAFSQDLPNSEIRLLDAGHFAEESHTEEIAEAILTFLAKRRL